MIKKALEYLIGLGGANILTVGGREYADREGFPCEAADGSDAESTKP